MKRLLYSIVFVVVIGSAGYGTYYYLSNQKLKTSWELIPSNAILVYESNDLISSWNTLQENVVWQELQSVNPINRLKKQFEGLDSLTGENGSFANFFSNSTFLASLHRTSRDQLDFLLYHNLKQTNQLEFIKSIKDSLAIEKTTVREYQGYEINEIKKETGEIDFAYIIIQGNFVGSYNPVLIEDVIRFIKEDAVGFRNQQDKLFSVSNLQKDLGNLYINLEQLNTLFLSLLKRDSGFIQLLSNFADQGFLDFKAENKEVLLNGYFFTKSDTLQFLDIFENQQSSALGFANLIPQQAAYVIQQSFSNQESWRNKTDQFFKAADPSSQKSKNTLTSELDFNFGDLNKTIQTEVGKAVINAKSGNEGQETLIYVKSKDINESLKLLNNLALESAKRTGDTVYFEKYATKEIKEIKIEEFPKKWLSPLFDGHEQTFFSIFNDYMVFSNSIQAIKTLIQDIENENTWGKSVKMNQFLESCLQNSNFNIFVNSPQVLPILLPNLNGKWKEFLKTYQKSLSTLELLALQFSYSKEGFYTNLEAQYFEPLLADDFNYYETIYKSFTENPLISKPYVVKNHLNNRFETIVQDSSYNIYLFDSEGNELWMEPLGEPIVSEIHQLDFYKNNKLQYVFATSSKIHLLDRNGIYLEDYPKLIKAESPIEYFNLIDYDKSKNYRLLASTKNGKIFLMDKNGTFLGDWNPLSLGDRFATSPAHVRIRNKDFMIGIQRKGVVNVMNRNSSMKPEFPIMINDRVSGNVFYELGNNIENSYIIFITEGGEHVKISFSGKQEKKEQLVKPSKETIFNIIPDASSRNYIISRQDQQRLSILQSNGDIMFEKDYLSGNTLSVQYYYFGSDKSIIAVTDKVQNFTYLYTATGELIHSQPTESSNEIAILYYSNDNEFRVFKTFGNMFSVQKFNY